MFNLADPSYVLIEGDAVRPEDLGRDGLKLLQHKDCYKLDTASVLLAWFASSFVRTGKPCEMLELGSGTGGVSVLASARSKNAHIDAVELVELAYKAGKMGGNMPAILNGANELAVDSFLDGKCRFIDIERINFEVCQKGEAIYKKDCSLEDIIYANSWATQQAQNIIDSLEGE